jgi:hypothetical protein
VSDRPAANAGTPDRGASADPRNQIPLGSRSVLSASGKPGAIVYVPVPMMTQPQLRRAPVAPQPPAPQIPQPPRAPVLPGTVDEANAFGAGTPPVPPPPPQPGITGVSNAFGAPVQDNGEGGAFMPRRGGATPPQMARMPYPPVPGQGMYPVPNNQMMAQGYGYPPPYYNQAAPGAYQTPYNPALAQGTYPPPYAVAQARQAANPYPAAQAPTAPSQARSDIVPAGYTGSKSAEQPAGDEIARQLTRILQESLYPSERERAADNLATRDWHTSPAVVDTLVKAAQEDPAATVRAACVRGLARMEVNTVPVHNALQALQTDQDPRVRREVEQALAGFRPK